MILPRLLVACLAVLAMAPSDNRPLDDFHKAVLRQGVSMGDASPPAGPPTNNPHVRLFAAIVRNSAWRNSSIPVCWENPSDGSAQAMQWTQDAVSKTWEKSSQLKFLGWAPCAPINNGIRIRISDEGPHVKTLGRFLDRLSDGMVLNFSFRTWSTSCQSTPEYCVRAIAVHEFGHAVGFTHEQNRADAPGECRLLAQGTNPDSALTPYDPKSVMNYCNKDWNNSGFLSALDVEAVRVIYPSAGTSGAPIGQVEAQHR